MLDNVGTADLTVAIGASDGQAIGLGGTSPTFTVPAGSRVVIESVAGFTIDSTHKTILFTPALGAILNAAIGGCALVPMPSALGRYLGGVGLRPDRPR